MAEPTKVERLFGYLYFKPKTLNGKVVDGKFEPLKVRFLYAAVEQIPMGKVHLYSYADKKFSRVLCLTNGLNKVQSAKVSCPMCDEDRFGTPSNKYYAFVEDLNDGSSLKLLEFNYGLGKQLDEIAEITGRPLHDLTFTITKKGKGTDTTYTPIMEDKSAFSVSDYFEFLNITDYPKIVGPVGERCPIMILSAEQMTDFIDGKYPWSDGNTEYAESTRKYTTLGAQVTVRGDTARTLASNTPAPKEEVDEVDVEAVADFSDNTSFF